MHPNIFFASKFAHQIIIEFLFQKSNTQTYHKELQVEFRTQGNKLMDCGMC
jgi:hypothetical protein